jgi:beta-phosphoglucomutase-like phosphatase (HAD superfamily)
VSWDAVIFDCDGTLVDSERLGNEVLVEYLEQFDVSLTADEALARFHGVHMAECIAQIEAIRGAALPQAFVGELRLRMASAFTKRLQPIDGAADLVRSLTVPCCVASSGPREKIELSLALTGLLPLFENAIYSSYEMGRWIWDCFCMRRAQWEYLRKDAR